MNKQITRNIAIIGAGASGLFLSRKLGESMNCKVIVFEKENNAGAKLRASGGGRANILNSHLNPECYNNTIFIQNLLYSVDYEILKNEFKLLGMPVCEDNEHRVYPATFYSQTVIDVLMSRQKNIQFIYNYEVISLKKCQNGWKINDYPQIFDNVVLASGSPANLIPKKKLHFNQYLEQLHLKQTAFTPSLVGFKIENYDKSLFGCRIKTMAKLFQKEKCIFQESGEVIFKEDGISGIVILNCSAYYNRLKNKNNCRIVLNLLHNQPPIDLQVYLRKYGNLCGILHPKLHALYQKNPFDLENFTLKIKEPYGMEFAQVGHGGIDAMELTEYFELKNHAGLFAIGEMLNIDGICGGYNLFFAFASALVVATKIIRDNEN